MRKLFSLFFFTPMFFLAQLETSWWHFGSYASLHFQNGNPVPNNLSGLWSQFSSSSISDSLGNLQFYVRAGDLVFNKNNDTMANGVNIGGYGGTQASVIIKKSGTKYYVITYNNLNYYQPSVFPSMAGYAIVDMGLASGLGSVTISGQTITPPGWPIVGKLAATKHCNGKDHWVLMHSGGEPGSYQYYAYLVTSSSISTTPVTSSIGSIQHQGFSFYRGVHKFSPNGRKVAATLPFKTVEVYDFNTSTGQLSNVLKLDSLAVPSATYDPNDPAALGLEFSPDGSKLYVTYANGIPFLCQFNLSAGSPSAVIASKTIIASDTLFSPAWYYGMQLGPNGKIYVVGKDSSKLGIINNPNSAGLACNYVPASLPLGTYTNVPNAPLLGSGLPGFVSNFSEQKPVLPPLTGSIVCGAVSYSAPVLSAMAGYSLSSYYWNFNDPLSGANTSTLSNPTHTFSANGTYTVKLALNYYPCGTDTLKQVINITGLPVFSVTGKTTICKGESTVLNFSGANAYTLNTTAIPQNTAQVQPTLTTVYTVTAKDNSSGCSSLKTLTVTVLPCVGISETSLNESLKVYPNPNSGVFTFETPEACEIKIHNSLGQEVFRASVSVGTSLIDISRVAKGVYLLEWNSKTSKGKVKVVLD